MTTKRFQWVFIKDNELELRDNGIVRRFSNERLEELLNELHKENQELKTDIQLHIDYSEEYRKLSLQFDDRNKELVSENALLEKENEQLKQQVDFFKALIKGVY